VSIWDKIIGGAAGFAVGGPLGALLGAVAGHLAGKAIADIGTVDAAGRDAATADRTFAVAAIVLGAKMAKADGIVTKDEIAAFKAIFKVPRAEVDSVARLFDEARRDATGFEPYARQVAEMFKATPGRLEDLLGALARIAAADGAIDDAEADYLKRVAAILGVDGALVDRLRRQHDTGPGDPYRLLGVTRKATNEEIKAAHRTLVSKNHPDRLAARGEAATMVAEATDRLARINDAYDRIRRERRSKP
jgi:DnaJ like chaperone protein